MDVRIFKRMDEISDTYWWYRDREAFVETILNRIPMENGNDDLVLDVGCGTGAMFSFLQRWGQVIGMEPSGEALLFAGKRPHLGLVRAEAERSPFQSGRFSLIAAFDCLEHISDDMETLMELNRMLHETGILILSVPAFRFLWSRRDRQLGHLRRYNIWQLKAILKAAGFHTVYAGYGYLCLFFPLLLKALWDHITPEPATYSSDIKPLPEPWNAWLTRWIRMEARWTARFKLPFGASVFAAARRKGPISP